jgi:hypothetical protein
VLVLEAAKVVDVRSVDVIMAIAKTATTDNVFAVICILASYSRHGLYEVSVISYL